MREKAQHYYSQFPDAKFKLYSISESLRKHLYIFKTLPGVFSFRKIDLGTKVLIENMTIPMEPSILLDLGCGYGPIGIVLANEAPNSLVYLVEVNKRAVWCVKENIKLNTSDNLKRLKVFTGNFFEPLKDKGLKFDGIYMNPPLRQGRKEFINLCYAVPNYLRPNGFFQFIIKKKMGASYVLNHLRDYFTDQKIDVLCKRSGYWFFNCIFD